MVPGEVGTIVTAPLFTGQLGVTGVTIVTAPLFTGQLGVTGVTIVPRPQVIRKLSDYD